MIFRMKNLFLFFSQTFCFNLPSRLGNTSKCSSIELNTYIYSEMLSMRIQTTFLLKKWWIFKIFKKFAMFSFASNQIMRMLRITVFVQLFVNLLKIGSIRPIDGNLWFILVKISLDSSSYLNLRKQKRLKNKQLPIYIYISLLVNFIAG